MISTLFHSLCKRVFIGHDIGVYTPMEINLLLSEFLLNFLFDYIYVFLTNLPVDVHFTTYVSISLTSLWNHPWFQAYFTHSENAFLKVMISRCIHQLSFLYVSTWSSIQSFMCIIKQLTNTILLSYIFLSIYLSMYLSIYLSTYIAIYLSILNLYLRRQSTLFICLINFV